MAAVRAALEDADRGLFGKNVIRIGQVMNSHIHAACLAVDGALAVHSLVFRLVRPLRARRAITPASDASSA